MTTIGEGFFVLVVGILYQLPPLWESSVYMHPRPAHLLDDLTPIECQSIQLHEVTQILRHNNQTFAEKLNIIQTNLANELFPSNPPTNRKFIATSKG